jgi:hypothetical protein
VLSLTEYDKERAHACPTELHNALTTIVDVRNVTTHELASEKMRTATDHLLDLIEGVLNHDEFGALLKRSER